MDYTPPSFDDGFTAEKLLCQGYSYIYDDVIFLPHYIDFPTNAVQLDTRAGVLLEQLKIRAVLKFVPYTLEAVKKGFQDLGASSLQSAHDLLRSKVLRLEVRIGEEVEGGVHGLISYEKKSF
ncbi:hypothetical protein K1719_031095 [Acacia pycnantha]|nr:hypothetical protein K1719_031095 [Acacia pycnantha]